MEKMAIHTELRSSTAFENPLGNMTTSSSSAKGSEDPHLVTNIIVILLVAAVLIPLNVLLLKKNVTVFRTVFLTKNDNNVEDQDFIRKNEGESFTIPTIPKEGPILVAKNVDLQRFGSPHSTIVDITYSYPRDGSEVDTGEPKRQIVKTFSSKLKPSPNVQELDSSATFETLLPDPKMKGQTKGLLASTSKYDGDVTKTNPDLLLSTSSEIRKKEDPDNEMFDAKFDQSSTDGSSIITSGTDVERAAKEKLVEVEMAKLPRLSLAGKECLEMVAITTPDTMVQNDVTERSAMPRDTMEIVETAGVVGHSVKQSRNAEQEIPMTPSFSTEGSRAAWEDYGDSPRASIASWTSSGRIYGVSSDTALQTQISQAMHWHLSEFAASPSTVNVETPDTFPEGSLSTDVAAQGFPPNVKRGSLQQIKIDDEGISTSPTASTGVFRKTARQIRSAQQGLPMSPEASSEESRKVLKQVKLVEQETSTSPTDLMDSTQAFRKAVRRDRLVQQGVPTASTVSNEKSDETVRQIRLVEQRMQKSLEVSSEEPSETAEQVNLIEHETRGSRRASPSSWSISEGSNASLQTEISFALQHYFSRRSSVRPEDTKEVAEEPDVDKS